MAACLGIMGFLFIAVVVIFCVIFAKKPDLLRSEEFQLRKQSLEQLGSRSKEFNTTAEHILLISKPDPVLTDSPAGGT